MAEGLNGRAKKPLLACGIGGDISPILRNQVLFEEGNATGLFDGLLGHIAAADVAMVNLETPLIRHHTPMLKAGPVLGAPEKCIRGLTEAGIHWVGLANNHILDHGATGLTNTIETCRGVGIGVFGAGPDLEEASQIRIVTVRDYKVGLLGIAAHEFSTARANRAGTNPIDPIALWRNLTRRHDWDVLITLVHAGVPSYPLPSPKLQSLCRYLVDLGSSAVVCQHSHCPGTIEEYNGALIVYGQGNLIFDWIPAPSGDWCQGFWVQVKFKQGKLDSYEIVPYEQSTSRPGARALPDDSARAMLTRIAARGRQVGSEVYVREEWSKFCAASANGYYAMLRGNRVVDRIARRICDELDLKWKPFSLQHRLALGNLLRCEDHREVLEEVLLEE